MRLFFLCKRRPQQRDLATRPYGRFHHLPLELARRGHECMVAYVDHRGEPEQTDSGFGFTRLFIDARTQGVIGAHRRLREVARDFQPDWITSFSDAWTGVWAGHLASAAGARLGIDAYDNYESYMRWNLPLHLAWRRAIAYADAVTVAGPQLAALLARHRRAGRAPSIVPMAADPAFAPRDRTACREAVGLPRDARLVGYYGGWGSQRGTDLLLSAFARLRQSCPDVRLVLTGRLPDGIADTDGVLPLGYVDDEQLPAIISSLDVACVITADTSFGRYSYPSKLCEAMACGVPVVATASDPVRWMLAGNEDCLSPIGDPDAFAGALATMIDRRSVDYVYRATWATSAAAFEASLVTVA